ncbi:MAG TPA: VapE domain-containing protein [Bryobacteraceae bacterium]|nr:VapE domain-containing protein [Bryobacteraceae bacterium]
MKLAAADYAALERSWITPEIADAAGLYRVCSIEGRGLVGRNGAGDYSGIVFPYFWPGQSGSVLDRLRLDHPPVDAATGKPLHKYLTAYASRNRLYLPPGDAALLDDVALELVIVEGEKKCLALWRAALESGNGTGRAAFLVFAISGVWNWKGTVGVHTNAGGERGPEKGPIPDLDRIAWSGRKVTILFDANAAANPSVNAARRELARELTRRGAKVFIADLPAAKNVNGIDDHLAMFGLHSALELLGRATPFDWRGELVRSDRGIVRAILANAISALRYAPEWVGVLAWDQFAMRVVARRDTPWGSIGEWTDQEDRRACEWLQHSGILVKLNEAGQAVQTVARDRSFHPGREYLESLKWDDVPRIDDWLTLYCHAESSPFTRAVGARWLTSAVARVCEPGCKADCCLILEGPQGIGKSTTLRILGGDWYTDDVAELTSKDAAIGTRSKWIIEFAELDAISRAEASKIKAFVSRATDHFRLPYDKRAGDFPRECIFAGTVNHSAYLKDETGGRRFWPVVCGRINLEALTRDRDQLWAEAVVRYRGGARWWLDTPELVKDAQAEQDERYDDDPWEQKVADYLEGKADTSVSQILLVAVDKATQHWTQTDKTRVARCLIRLDWERYRRREGKILEWRYRRKEKS